MSEAKLKGGYIEWCAAAVYGASVAQVSNSQALGSTHPELNQRSTHMKPIDYYAPTAFVSAKARNVEEAKADLAKAEAALAAETALNEFKTEINRKVRLANSIVQALSDVRDLATDMRDECIARTDYAEFKTELCATLKDYGYKVVFIGDKSKAIVAKV